MLAAADVDRLLAALRGALAKAGTPERAAGARRYLKSDLEFLGADVPSIRREAQALVRAHPELERRGLRALAEAAWQSQVHELRSAAIGILERRRDALAPADARWLIRLVERSDTWAHVDWLSIKVIGALTARHASLAPSLDRWARHECFWVRRAALLSFHDALRAGAGDFGHFAGLAATMLGEREFFIRKAIGWVLRSVASKRPALVARFVSEHLESLSGLTYREATRALPAAQRTKLAARWTKLAAQRTSVARSPGRARRAPSRATRARRAPA